MMIRRLPVALLAATALAGCAVGPDYRPPVTPAAVAQPFVGTPAAPVTAAAPRAEWWRLYEDPVLDRLVADALVANKDIAVAVANVAQARAVLREQRAGRLPQTGINASAEYGQRVIAQVPGLDRRDWIYDGGLNVSYEVDVFGRVARSVEAARGDADAAQAALDVTRVAVVAETTRAYADAVSSAERLAVQERTLELLDRTVSLTGKRFAAGRSSRLDVSRAGALREQQRALLPPLRGDRAAALFRLATLTGRAPAELPQEVSARTTTLHLSQQIPVGDGRALLERRPDVREAERRLAAQTARIGVATSALYPQISLGGSIGNTATAVGDLFTGGALRWLLGPLLSWTFPNQEANRARIAQADAAAQAALARFDGVVLVALQETETALNRYAQELQRREALRAAAEQARIAARIVRAQLREGRTDFLVVLDAERTSALADADLAASDAAVTNAQVDLFRALGGGWQDAPEPRIASR